MTEKEYIKRLGEKIQKKREELELSRELLAERAKLTRMHIYRIENAETRATITALRRIAKEFNVPLGELVSL